MKAVARAGLALLPLALAACASQGGTVQSSWYYLGRGAERGLYVALLNQSTEPVVLEGVAVNESAGAPAGGWRWIGASPERPLELEPGAFRLIPITEFARQGAAGRWEGLHQGWGCRLPVHVAVVDRVRGRVVTEGLPGMPSAIPQELLRSCARHTTRDK